MAGASVLGRATKDLKALKVLKAIKADGRQRLWRNRKEQEMPTACLVAVVARRAIGLLV